MIIFFVYILQLQNRAESTMQKFVHKILPYATEFQPSPTSVVGLNPGLKHDMRGSNYSVVYPRRCRTT